MKVKILNSFQTSGEYYNGNVNVDWDIVDNSIVNSRVNKFHFFKFFDIDNSWVFDDPSYIFPLLWSSVKDKLQDVVEFINAHKDLFLQKKLIPVFLDLLEGDTGIAEEIDNVVIATNISIFYISGDYKLKTRNNRFNFIYIDQWQHHITGQEHIIEYAPIKDYINLTRVCRPHRCTLMQALIDTNLLSNGYNTWANTYDEYSEYLKLNPTSTIHNYIFDTLDVTDITKENPTLKVPLDFCKQSTIYLVSETHASNDRLFLSEKTYKPISIGMPFMILGSPGTLELLREKGYSTFSEWIDESYDYNYSLEKRIHIIIKNLVKISSMSTIKKIEMRRSMSKTCQYNLDLYNTFHKKNTFLEVLNAIKSISSKG